MKALNAQPYHSSPFRSAAAVGNTVATAMPSTAIEVINTRMPMLSPRNVAENTPPYGCCTG